MSSYKQHQIFANKVMLHVQQKHKDIRLWGIATGQAYAKFSVKNALSTVLKTKNFNEAMKQLVIIVYGKIGHPDISGLLHGIWIGIEIKTGNAVQSKDQKNFEAMIKKAGGVYIVVSDKYPIEDQIKPLEQVEDWYNNVKS